MKSDSVEEETRVQNPGSLFRAGFLVWGLMASLIVFWVSSSQLFNMKKLLGGRWF